MRFFSQYPRGLPDMPFFCHTKVKGHKAGSQFDPRMLLRWWRKACDNLGIEGVDLYGGTRHSTVNYLKQFFTKEEIKNNGTRHSTSKAFERYFGDEVEPSLDIFQKSRRRIEKNTTEPHPDHVIHVVFKRKALL